MTRNIKPRERWRLQDKSLIALERPSQSPDLNPHSISVERPEDGSSDTFHPIWRSLRASSRKDKLCKACRDLPKKSWSCNFCQRGFCKVLNLGSEYSYKLNILLWNVFLFFFNLQKILSVNCWAKMTIINLKVYNTKCVKSEGVSILSDTTVYCIEWRL